LEQYARENPRRATGGLYSLAGFDFQLRLYLATLVDHLSLGTPAPLVEAFSDIARPTSGDRLVMVQVKRTLNRNSLREAADEVAVIDEFLEKHDPDLRLMTRFEVAGLQKDDALELTPTVWEGLEVPAKAKNRDSKNARLRTIYGQERLLAPRIEPDPWRRVIEAVFERLYDPFGFADQALQLCLRRGIEPSGAFDLREEIERLYAKHREGSRTKARGPGFAGIRFQPLT
jgi:hypothetical protein